MASKFALTHSTVNVQLLEELIGVFTVVYQISGIIQKCERKPIVAKKYVKITHKTGALNLFTIIKESQ